MKKGKEKSKTDTSVLPTTVIDQIRLWEMEKTRIKSSEGHLWTDFKSQIDFDLVKNYVEKDLGMMIWHDELSRQFFVGPEAHQLVR